MSSPPGISPVGPVVTGCLVASWGTQGGALGDPHVPVTSWCLQQPCCACGFPRSLPAAVLLLAPGFFAALWVGQRAGNLHGTSPGVMALLAEVGTEVRPHKTPMGDAGPCGARQQQDIVGVSSTPRQPPVTAGAGTEGGGCGLPGCPHPPQGTRSPSPAQGDSSWHSRAIRMQSGRSCQAHLSPLPAAFLGASSSPPRAGVPAPTPGEPEPCPKIAQKDGEGSGGLHSLPQDRAGGSDTSQ